MRKNSSSPPTATYDAILIGGGLAGTVAALLLAKGGLRVAVIDQQDPKTVLAQKFDGRTTALSYGGVQILRQAGIWQKLQKQAEPILHIEIFDGHGPVHMNFHHDAIGTEPMGHIVMNLHLRQCLFQAVQNNRNIQYLAPCRAETIERNEYHVGIKTDTGKILSAPLLIAADGRKSELRRQSGLRVREHDYRHTAITASIRHTLPHHQTAFECFHKSGPLALLPMPDYQGKSCSSLVWSEPPEVAQALMQTSDSDFCALLMEKFGDHLGELSLLSPRQAWPLNLIFAEKFYAERMALIGDAAHGIHPIAGQGLNLGLRDVECLAELLIRHKKLGGDLGSQILLRDYNRQRQFDCHSMIAATHSLNWLFGQDHAAVKLLRGIGLKMVDYIPRVKNMFIKQAMGDFR